MTDALDAWIAGEDIEDEETQPLRHLTMTEELMWTRLDIRARELALKSALRAHGPTPGDRLTASTIVFTARAFYDFLTGEHDADQTEQSQ